MIIEKNGVINSEGKKPILYDLYFNKTQLSKPIIIFCHGYKGYKDWGAWDLVAEKFASEGFFFLKFNFSHNGGTIKQPIDFPDLEAFAQNNFSTELEDLQRVIDFLSSETKHSDEYDQSDINLIGHSRGAGIVIIKAIEELRVKSVITWAGVSDFKIRFQEGSESFNLWKKTGRTYIENARTKQQMPHDWQFYQDFIEHESRLTIKTAVKNLSKPHLIIHGSKDTTVSLKEAQSMNFWNPESQLKVIENADHVFGASHPWQSNTLSEDLKRTVEETLLFLKRV